MSDRQAPAPGAAREGAAAPGRRVALVLGPSAGGIGAHVRDLVEHCVRRGDAVVVAGPESTEPRFRFTAGGARFVPLPGRPAAAVLTLRRVLTGVVVVHAHGLKAAALTNAAARTVRRARIPRRVVTLHNAVLATGLIRPLLSRYAEALAVRGADAVLAASADLARRAGELGAAPSVFCPVPARPLDAPARERAAVRAGFGLPDGVCLLLAVGRLASQKAYPLLLAAVRLLAERHPETAFHLVIAGEGPERERLTARIAGHGLPVTLAGHRSDIADLLAAADALVLSSRWEARPLVIQEALRAGTPVVATAVGGIPELVGDAALLVPFDDAAALAEALHAVLGDERLRSRLRRDGPARAAAWPGFDAALAAARAWHAPVPPGAQTEAEAEAGPETGAAPGAETDAAPGAESDAAPGAQAGTRAAESSHCDHV